MDIPLSKEALRAYATKRRNMKIKTTIREIKDAIIKKAGNGETECSVQIVPKNTIHCIFNNPCIEIDIVVEVYAALQSIIGDVEHSRTDTTLHFKW